MLLKRFPLMLQTIEKIYEFADFRLDEQRRILSRDGENVALPPKAFDLLLELVKSGGRVVGKNELLETVWQGAFVEDNNLTVNMTLVRKALGERRGEHRFVVTVPGQGYKWVAPVTRIEDENLYLEQISTTSIVVEEEILGDPFGDAIVNAELRGREDAKLLSDGEPTKFAVLRSKDSSLTKISAAPPLLSGTAQKTSRSRLIPLAAFGMLLIAAAVIYFIIPNRQIESVTQIRTLAVLPFKPLDANPNDALLGLGMADSLTAKLSRISRITVRPTSAIAKYAAPEANPLAAGKELSVDALLDGKIQRIGNRLRVTVQLLRVSDNAPLWAGSFDAKETDIFAVQDSISVQVADSLALKLNQDERNLLAKNSTQNPEAYKLYLNGLFQLNKRTLTATRLAISYFEQATEKQPDYALPYAGLGDAFVMLGNQEALLGALPPRETLPKAKSALNKALALDDTLPEAYAARAWVTMWETGDIDLATRDLQRALELNPNYAAVHNYFGIRLMSQGKFDEALAVMNKAKELDQFSLVINLNIGTVLYRARRYDQAEQQARKTLELGPDFARAHWLMGLIQEQVGKYEQAIASFQRAVELSGDGTLAKASLAHALAKAGRRVEAEKMLADLLKNEPQRYVPPDSIAMIFAALGKPDEAFRYLEKAVNDRPFSMFLLKIEQRFDPLRSDSRFSEIENKMSQP